KRRKPQGQRSQRRISSDGNWGAATCNCTWRCFALCRLRGGRKGQRYPLDGSRIFSIVDLVTGSVPCREIYFASSSSGNSYRCSTSDAIINLNSSMVTIGVGNIVVIWAER